MKSPSTNRLVEFYRHLSPSWNWLRGNASQSAANLGMIDAAGDLGSGLVVCSIAEQQSAIAWVQEHIEMFRGQGRGSKYLALCRFDPRPEWAVEIRQRLINCEGLESCTEDGSKSDFIGLVTQGGLIRPKMDKNIANLIHVRYHVFLQMPLQGGRPIYGGVVHEPSERSYRMHPSGLAHHTSQIVESEQPLIMLSYGFFIERDRISC